MSFLVVGINHQRVAVGIRERLAIANSQIQPVLADLKTQPAVKGGVVLSTCNRVEYYADLTDSTQHESIVAKFLQRQPDLITREALYIHQNEEAAKHLFEVVCGANSLVTGETQIVSQVREAYQLALQNGFTSSDLNKLFEKAFEVAKTVRHQTQIGQGNVSVGSVAVRLTKQIFRDLHDKSVVIVGAGEIAELVLTHLAKEEPRQVYIVNRTFNNAKQLQDQGLGQACQMSELGTLLLDADIVVTSVAGVLENFQKSSIQQILRQRGDKKLFLIDLGVPRNIDAAVAEIDNVYLFNIDDLQRIASENQSVRDQAVKTAKNIVEQEVNLFYSGHINHSGLPTIALLSQKFEQIRQNELDRSLLRLTHLAEADRLALDKMTKAIVTRILHDPILLLSDRSQKVEPAMVSLLKKVFRLDDENE